MFRPTFENLERREVFSGEPLPMEEVSLAVAVEVPIPASTLNVGPQIQQLGGDFNGDADVDAADYVLLRTGLTGDFNSDGRPDLAVKSPRDSASGLATGIVAAVATGMDVNRLNAFASPSLLDDLIGWDLRSRTIGETNPLAAHDATFDERGGNGIIAILIGLVHQSPDRIAVDPSDPSGNTLVQRRASVTDLVIDPFDRSILVGTDGGIWRG
jgi:hypothetical protein